MLRSRKTAEIHWPGFIPLRSVIKPLHFSARGKQQAGKQWTANLVLWKCWHDLVKITQLMITFVEHLAILFAQCMVMGMWKISMSFDSSSSLWRRTEKISMWACQPCRLAKRLLNFSSYLLMEWPTWWKDPQLDKLKNHHCQVAVGIMKEDHLDWRSISCAAEGLLFDSHNADVSDEEDVDEYFGDVCMFEKHD